MKKRYENLNGIANDNGLKEIWGWMKERRGKIKDLSSSIPLAHDRDAAKLKNLGFGKRTAITWIGHSTFLIQTGSLNIITDPVWAGRMGLQKRLIEPGYALTELPDIHVVLISHGHYDHLDFSTLRLIKGMPMILVPVGLKRALTRKGYRNVHELNWGEHIELDSLSFSFVPAQHWTRRTLWDTNTSHWGGWVIDNGSGEAIYFAGDTGYFEGFKHIGESFNIKTALMPIGAYEPEWFMRVSHMNPEDSIRAFLEVGATTFIPMHYGTFRLADDTGPEALQRLLVRWNELSLEPNRLAVLAVGETLFGS